MRHGFHEATGAGVVMNTIMMTGEAGGVGTYLRKEFQGR